MGGFASLYIWGIGGERKAALKKDNFAGLSDLWVKRIFTSCVFNILKLYKTKYLHQKKCKEHTAQWS